MELRTTIDCGPILREFGAHVGEGATIYGPLHVMNADGDFSRLWIGDRVYLGTATTVLHGVTIVEQATVGAHCLVRKAVPAHTTFVSPEGRLAEPAG